MSASSPRIDVHQQLTDKIVRMMEAGPGTFAMPWRRNTGKPLFLPENVLTKKRYRGINIVSLWGAAEEANFASPIWGTYKQWQEKGAQVRKGEKGSLVVVYKEFHVAPEEDNDKDDGRRMFARASWVFNAAQVDGFEVGNEKIDDLGPIEKRENAEAFVRATGATIVTGGDRACYVPSMDIVKMPDEGRFIGENATRTESWYAVLAHELVHWTGPKKRLDREFGKRFGDEAYAFEELVAELGAAFLCASLNISNEPRADHAQYLDHWLKILKQDKRAIFTAAAKASAAADYLEAFGSQSQQLAA